MNAVVEKFLKYVVIDTKSDDASETCPSTAKQFDLAKLLVEELKAMGIASAAMDDNGYVMAEIPSNVEHSVPAIGLIAHMDTSPDFSGKDVKPLITENYDGGDIVLNKAQNIVLSVKDFPELPQYKGQTIISTDGTTLLGADNKAGIAEIMAFAEFVMKTPSYKHGAIKIGFTPDEEIGRGADLFDVKKFGADFAYTIDGGEIGEIEYENFNAASAELVVNGINIHPGSAKHKMKNAVLIGMELNGLLPTFEIPGYTEKYEGFYHLDEFNGNVSKVEMFYIIRDHSREKFEAKKELMTKAVTFINEKYGAGTVELKITDSYYNMKEKILPVMHVVDTAVEAMEMADIEPKIVAIRGGTDGARLSYMGLPTPNIFTGGHNFHGKYEYCVVESMEKAVEVIKNIISLYAAK
ncbi:MAG: peptidase T [Clostridia bacterium]|nr:peptidase T [Clostridia bacterium]